jgi:hypothetical protein
MAKQSVKFAAFETVKRPIRLKFKTKSGKTVFIRALKIVKKKQAIPARAKAR